MNHSVRTIALLWARRALITKDNHHGTSEDSFYDSDMLILETAHLVDSGKLPVKSPGTLPNTQLQGDLNKLNPAARFYVLAGFDWNV